jgi:hypothetical protein
MTITFFDSRPQQKTMGALEDFGVNFGVNFGVKATQQKVATFTRKANGDKIILC